MRRMSPDANTGNAVQADAPTSRRQFSQPRVAEMIAGVLRNRIVNGDLEDGKVLPKQEDLLNEFGVSLPSLREAMRILETEGLISVRRGNLGGAVVHRPTSEAAAYILGLVLQSERVVLSDVAAALRVVEPACAAMCAASSSRRRIAARLRALIAESEKYLDNGPEFTRSSNEFHDELARMCGNTTLKELLGTLETLWSHFETRWADETTRQGMYPGVKLLRRDVTDHEAIAKAIFDGDEQQAERASRRHLEQVHRWLLTNAGNQPLAITELRVGLSSSQLRRPIAL